ncbi:MAG: NAD(P)-dependent alcohol dehydrogenase [Alphaproteobacteria bacterium]
MKAMTHAAAGGLEQLRLADLPGPGQPKAGEIRVRIHGSSLNYHDYLVANGTIPTADGRIMMSDGAGVVEAIGEGVAEFAVGDSVVSVFFPMWQDGQPRVGDFRTVPGDGVDGYARESVVRPAIWFTRAPTGWTHTESATLTTAGATAWRALVVDGAIKAGNTVLALGTGGVSIFALQFAKAMGASVIVTSSSDEKLERVKALGADHTLNYKTTPEWGAAVRKLTGGGVDHVIEVGGPGTLPQSINAVRVGGHIALIGALTGRSGELPTPMLFIKQVRLLGLIVGNRRWQQEMVQGIDAMNLRPVIDTTFPLDRLADAFRHEESGKHFGKICVEI